MNKIKVLIWDDRKNEAQKMGNTLESIKTAHKWPLDHQIMHCNYQFFHQYLQDKHADYDLLIIDCMDKKQNVATQALKMLKNLNSNLNVIITSLYQPEEFELLPELYDKKRCQAILKNSLQSPNHPQYMEKVIAEMFELQINQEGITDNIQLTIDDEIYLKYLVEVIGGEKIIKQLILNLKEHLKYNSSSKFILKSLSQGLSGAIVFCLIIKDQNGNSTYKFLKLSNKKESILDELNKSRNEYGEIPQKYVITYLSSDTPIRFKDYYIVLAGLINKSMTLRKYIIEDRTGNKSVKILNELMIKCLRTLYHRRIITSSDQTLHTILKLLDLRRLAFLSASNEELNRLIGETNVINKILELKKEVKDNSVFYQKDNLKNTLIHGDLHSNNIILDASENIFIIDPANMKTDHWSRDICMLIVDIFAYHFDINSVEYFATKKIKRWKELGVNIIKNIKIPNDGKNAAAIASINWLSNKENLKKIFSDFFEPWEFQMSLGVEFLRASYRTNLPAGKRAACLLIGAASFSISEKSYKHRIKA